MFYYFSDGSNLLLNWVSLTTVDLTFFFSLTMSTSPSSNTLQHTATHCNTLQHTATHCNTLQHTATHYNTRLERWLTRMSTSVVCVRKNIEHTATHCNTVQHTETHCNTPQHTAAHCNSLQQSLACAERTIETLQHTATRWNPLQHTATHCNKLQRTATQFGVWSKKYRALIRLGRLPSKQIEKPLDGTYSSPQRTATHCNLLQHSQRWFVWAPLKIWKALGWYVNWKTSDERLTQKYRARTRHLGGLPCESGGKIRRSTYSSLQHTATHCNSLQHTATHCNALQRTAAHCNKKSADLSA